MKTAPRTRLSRAGVALALAVGFGASAVMAEAEGELEQPRHLLVDGGEFAARLPAQVFVAAEAEGSAAAARLRAALSSLEPVEARIRKLPAGAMAAKPRTKVPPIYPYDMKVTGEQGEARFLLLIGADGQIKAMHCYESSDGLFERRAAEALVQWTFAPARIGRTNVPMILELPIVFRLAP